MKVIYVDSDMIRFEDKSELYSGHDQDCCESHYLTFKDLNLTDFEGLDFDLSSDTFFERVADYGVRLLPTNGQPVSVPGYGYNNGYYSSNLSLVLDRPPHEKRIFNISECQYCADY
jgi:hypothetical protein